MSIANILSLNCWIFDCRSDSPIGTPYQSISEDDFTTESVALISSAPMPTTVRNLKFSSSFRRSLAHSILVSKPSPGMSCCFYIHAIYSAYFLYEHVEMRRFQQRHVTKNEINETLKIPMRTGSFVEIYIFAIFLFLFHSTIQQIAKHQ